MKLAMYAPLAVALVGLSGCASSGAGPSGWAGRGVMSFSSAHSLCRNEARLGTDATRSAIYEACMSRNGWRRTAARP